MVDVHAFWELGLCASLKHTCLAEGLAQGFGVEACGPKSGVGGQNR